MANGCVGIEKKRIFKLHLHPDPAIIGVVWCGMVVVVVVVVVFSHGLHGRMWDQTRGGGRGQTRTFLNESVV